MLGLKVSYNPTVIDGIAVCNVSQSQQDFKFSTIELQSLGIRQNHLESARIVLGLKVSYNPTVIDGIAVCNMSQLGRLGLQFCLMASHRRRLGAISTQSNSIGLNCSRVVDFPQLSHNPVDCKKKRSSIATRF